MPLVSVVITTFNRISLLERALKSLELQTFKDFEVIVSDDCSTDDVSGFISNYKKNTTLNILFRSNLKNMGACYTRNKGIEIATGKYIAGLDDDDEYVETRLEELLNAYMPEYSFVTSNTLVIKKTNVSKLFKSDRLINLNDMLWGNIAGTQILTEKWKLTEIGGFDESLTSAQDADMWLRLIKHFGPAFRIDSCLYLLHTEHEEGRISTSARKIDGLKRAFEKHKSLMSKAQKDYHCFKIALYENNKKANLNVLRKVTIRFLPYLIYKKLYI